MIIGGQGEKTLPAPIQLGVSIVQTNYAHGFQEVIC